MRSPCLRAGREERQELSREHQETMQNKVKRRKDESWKVGEAGCSMPGVAMTGQP